jgi:hypothetical protein
VTDKPCGELKLAARLDEATAALLQLVRSGNRPIALLTIVLG